MAGLGIVVCVILYAWLGYRVLQVLRPMWLKALGVLFMLAVPTADEVFGHIELRRLCGEEGGLKVFRSVVSPGFLSDSLTDTILQKYPYSFVEARELSGYFRYTKASDGTIAKQSIEAPHSRYEHRTTRGDLSDTYRRVTFEVSTRDTYEVLGRVTDFQYAGGWVRRLIARVLAVRANAGTCELGPYLVIDELLITSTLKLPK